jgi:hypothetical protein
MDHIAGACRTNRQHASGRQLLLIVLVLPSSLAVGPSILAWDNLFGIDPFGTYNTTWIERELSKQKLNPFDVAKLITGIDRSQAENESPSGFTYMELLEISAFYPYADCFEKKGIPERKRKCKAMKNTSMAGENLKRFCHKSWKLAKKRCREDYPWYCNFLGCYFNFCWGFNGEAEE